MDIKGLLIKGSIGLAGAGGISYACYQAISSKSETQKKENIENKLEKEGYKLITQGSQHFAKILVDYKTVAGKNDELKFGDFAGDDKDGKTAKDILWKNCESAFKEESDTNLNKAKKWCVEPITIKALLTNQKLSILDTTKNDADTNGKWDEKVKDYRQLSVGDAQVFKALEVGGKSTPVTEEHRKIIKTKCDEAGKVISHNAEYEENLNNFKGWCLDKQ